MAKKKERNFDKIKELLIAQRKVISDGIDHIAKDHLNLSQKDASGDLSGYTFHMADVATDNFDREFSLDLASTEQQLLNKIQDAIESIEEGTYGTCEPCGKEISMKRLMAVPYATYCISCQEEEEKKERN